MFRDLKDRKSEASVLLHVAQCRTSLAEGLDDCRSALEVFIELQDTIGQLAAWELQATVAESWKDAAGAVRAWNGALHVAHGVGDIARTVLVARRLMRQQLLMGQFVDASNIFEQFASQRKVNGPAAEADMLLMM
jgi:hypothetical protein